MKNGGKSIRRCDSTWRPYEMVLNTTQCDSATCSLLTITLQMNDFQEARNYKRSGRSEQTSVLAEHFFIAAMLVVRIKLGTDLFLCPDVNHVRRCRFFK